MKYINVELNEEQGKKFEQNLKIVGEELGRKLKASHIVRATVDAFNADCEVMKGKEFIEMLD